MLSAKAVLPIDGRGDDHPRSPLLQAGGLFVQVGEAGRQARDVGLVFLAVQVVDALEHARQHRLDRFEALRAALAALADLEIRVSASSSIWPTSCPRAPAADSAISVATWTRRRWIERSRTSSA